MYIKKIFLALVVLLILIPHASLALNVTVRVANKPLNKADLSLWQASDKAPQLLGHFKSDAQGHVQVNAEGHPGFLYLKAKKGTIELISALGKSPKGSVVISELTTIATVFTHAQLIHQGNISAPEVSLSIASGHIPNLVDPYTGAWGKRLLDGINSTESETLSRLNTLGNLIALCNIGGKNKDCRAFLSVTGNAQTTLVAIENIAKKPWLNPDKIYQVFDQAYPTPSSTNPQQRRTGITYIPYLLWSPDDFSLSIRIAGGGIYAAGRIAFDHRGHLWSGQNWMPGGQNSAIRGIGGGLVELDHTGSPRSPNITGYTGMAVDGVGWGTTVIGNRVWLTSFNAVIAVFNLQGQPIGPANGITMNGAVGEGQGIAVDLEGNVWVANATKNNLIKFLKGDVTKGQVINVDGLKSPFSIAVDKNNTVYVTNALGTSVTKFPARDPDKADNIPVGISSRGLDIDSQGNVWVASLLSLDFPPPQFPKGNLTIMKEFEIAYNNLVINQNRTPSGVLSLIYPDGKKLDFTGVSRQINIPWGLNIDGLDNVWVGNFLGRSVLYICGAGGNCPPGYKTGDLIHNFKSGIIQSITDATIDQAGNLWIANNWNVLSVVTERSPKRSNSTKGGGSGITVIYGIASPIQWPRKGPVKPLLVNPHQ